ncbi:MAG: hypothetical protein FWC90_04875 [Oscillospiraceae bacterium]|nr:hypothetical protein [Oscillospiraceae bacterium]
MKKLLENIANLVKVKTLVTLAVVFVFIVKTMRGDIETDSIMFIVGTVTAFYFGTVTEKKL